MIFFEWHVAFNKHTINTAVMGVKLFLRLVIPRMWSLDKH